MRMLSMWPSFKAYLCTHLGFMVSNWEVTTKTKTSQEMALMSSKAVISFRHPFALIQITKKFSFVPVSGWKKGPWSTNAVLLASNSSTLCSQVKISTNFITVSESYFRHYFSKVFESKSIDAIFGATEILVQYCSPKVCGTDLPFFSICHSPSF